MPLIQHLRLLLQVPQRLPALTQVACDVRIHADRELRVSLGSRVRGAQAVPTNSRRSEASLMGGLGSGAQELLHLALFVLELCTGCPCQRQGALRHSYGAPETSSGNDMTQ